MTAADSPKPSPSVTQSVDQAHAPADGRAQSPVHEDEYPIPASPAYSSYYEESEAGMTGVTTDNGTDVRHGSVRSFRPTFPAERIEQMQTLLKHSNLPPSALDDQSDVYRKGQLGIDYDWLKEASTRLSNFDVKALESHINAFDHFLVEIEGTDLHFVHMKSSRANAVPLLLLHGWPGSFYDFHKIIKTLTTPGPNEQAFHVIIPSLPGYLWSPLPTTKRRKTQWTIEDNARIFNTLMVDVLGYKTYTAQGGDWGSHILRFIGVHHSSNAVLLHFNMFFAPPPPATSVVQTLLGPIIGSSLTRSLSEMLPGVGSEEEKHAVRRKIDFTENGRGYLALQSTKPSTIGYAVGSSPLALLAYIGEKHLAWSDPSSYKMNDLLATVVLYWMTDSFASSVMIYTASKAKRAELNSTSEAWGRLKLKSVLSFSLFPYEIGAAPRAWIERCGPLVEYYTHQAGGHFPALDNPTALVSDLQAFVSKYWNQIDQTAHRDGTQFVNA